MPSLISRVWNSSPASLTNSVRRRLRQWRRGESWRELKNGPAQGVKLILPDPPTEWAQEMIAGVFDKFLYDAIGGHRKLAGATCWDIGANIGYHSLALANQGARVVAFEPNAVNVARLELHLANNPALAKLVRVVAAAVADKEGEMDFLQSDDLSAQSSGSHLIAAMPPLPESVYRRFEHSTVPTITLDGLVEQKGEPPADILKIDVEGAEHLVLQGGCRFLAKHKPLLLVEVHHICAMLQCAQLLTELGYQLEVLDDQHATPSRCFLLAK